MKTPWTRLDFAGSPEFCRYETARDVFRVYRIDGEIVRVTKQGRTGRRRVLSLTGKAARAVIAALAGT